MKTKLSSTRILFIIYITGVTLALFLCFSSCARRIGDLTMIATRNIDSKTEYVELKRYAKSKGKTIEQAVDKTLRGVPGGEYMKNVVIYSNGKIEGDVWGVAGVLTEKEKKVEKQAAELSENKSQFSVGNKVSWKNSAQFGKIYTGEITGMGESKAMIKLENGKLVDIKYEILTKIQ